MHIILASGSPRRRELLLQWQGELGGEAAFTFEVMWPRDSAECGLCSEGGPVDLVAELALRKAADVVERLVAGELVPQRLPAVVLAADTVAECGGQVLGKPVDEEHARQILSLMSGKEHRVFTGVCKWELEADGPQVKDPGIETASTSVHCTTLRMDALTDEQLDEYLESGLWEGKAGAFGYQDRLGWVHIVEGSESNVVGLPREAVF